MKRMMPALTLLPTLCCLGLSGCKGGGYSLVYDSVPGGTSPCDETAGACDSDPGRAVVPAAEEIPDQHLAELELVDWLWTSPQQLADLQALLLAAEPTPQVGPAEALALLHALGALAEEARSQGWGLWLGVIPPGGSPEAPRVLGFPHPETGEPVELGELVLPTAACLHRWQTLAGGTPPALGELTNACAPLSTAYSLVYRLGVVPVKVATEQVEVVEPDGSREHIWAWKQDFLAGLRAQQGHDPRSGTTTAGLVRAYTERGLSCEAETLPLDGPRDAIQALAVRVAQGQDCTLLASGSGGGNPWGHAAYVRAAGIQGPGGVVVVADTAAQGAGTGEDVRIGTQPQVWTFDPTAPDPERVAVGGDNQGYFTELLEQGPVTRVVYVCCGAGE